MKTILVLAAALILTVQGASAAPWRLGLQAGVNASGLKGDVPSGVSYGNQYGLVAGAVGEIQLGEDLWLSFQPMYLQRGTTSTIAASGGAEPTEGPSISLDYLAVPILAKIVSDNGRTYFMGGLNPAFLLDAQKNDNGDAVDLGSSFRSVGLAADIGFGLLVPVGKSLLNFELRYEQSILNLASPENEGGDDFLPVRFRSSGFQFLAGLSVPLGGE